jgi:hypothetical protein
MSLAIGMSTSFAAFLSARSSCRRAPTRTRFNAEAAVFNTAAISFQRHLSRACFIQATPQFWDRIMGSAGRGVPVEFLDAAAISQRWDLPRSRRDLLLARW